MRFLALPDQADYLVLPVALTALCAAAYLPGRAALACCCATVAPAFVTVSLCARSPVDGALRFGVTLQPGDVAQEWAARRFNAAMDAPPAAATVLAHADGLGPLNHALYLPAFVTRDGAVVIGAEHVDRIDPAKYKVVWVCNAPLGAGIGWRGWQAPAATDAVRGAFACWRLPARRE